jgi:hypothetical protein
MDTVSANNIFWASLTTFMFLWQYFHMLELKRLILGYIFRMNELLCSVVHPGRRPISLISLQGSRSFAQFV